MAPFHVQGSEMTPAPELSLENIAVPIMELAFVCVWATHTWTPAPDQNLALIPEHTHEPVSVCSPAHEQAGKAVPEKTALSDTAAEVVPEQPDNSDRAMQVIPELPSLLDMAKKAVIEMPIPELSAPPWLLELPALPWSPELPSAPWRLPNLPAPPCLTAYFCLHFLENLAVDGSATQSSTSGDWFAEKAVDRGLQQLYTGCSSTLNETNPWWRLDLLDIYRVSKVVITNINYCCAEQINDAEIRIGNSLENNGNNNPICAVIPDIPAGKSSNYSCNGMEGRYVNLIIPGDMKILTLCEMKVFGEGPCLKRSFVKMQFNSSKDLTDPSMRENLGSALADRGYTGVTLRWSETPKKVIQKVNTDKRESVFTTNL
ncbi:uncharacterized protein [Chanodichthys erythropterus]|uniref:uncharacterized protein n=1 Tax=Chanodichthys erythropterus TaxID=933992 RepID=UPI00351E1C16